jgi:proton glutamate symport protein
MTIVFSSVGIPLEAIAIIAGVDRLLDMFRTAVNVAGDLTIAKIVNNIVKN